MCGWGDRAGAYDEEEAAARAYDLAALKYWGPGTVINFKVSRHGPLAYLCVDDRGREIVL
jgi:hypothetical protein